MAAVARLLAIHAGPAPDRSVLRPEHLVHLQRCVGNRAVSRLLGTSAGAPTVQRKRTDPPSATTIIKVGSRANLQQDLKDPADVRARGLWVQMQDIYDKSVVKGTDNWAKLQTALEAYEKDPRAVSVSLEQKRIAQEYDKRYKKYYSTEMRPGDPGQVTGSTWGGTKKSERKKKGTPAYLNHFDANAGLIRAASNFADKDKARTAKLGLPNSEILWQQYLDAIHKQLGVKRAKAHSVAANISQITREQVVNHDARIVVFMAYPEGDNVWSSTESWNKTQEEFLALLGTPNVTAVVHLLLDHMDDVGGKSVSQIITTTKETIEVHLEKAARRREEPTLVLLEKVS